VQSLTQYDEDAQNEEDPGDDEASDPQGLVVCEQPGERCEGGVEGGRGRGASRMRRSEQGREEERSRRQGRGRKEGRDEAVGGGWRGGRREEAGQRQQELGHEILRDTESKGERDRVRWK
jgi:hypothetical protein